MSEAIASGTLVLIEGADSWSVGKVEEIRKPQDLPHIQGAPDVGTVREIFTEMQIRRVAIISHHGLLFAALETHSGEWYDLQRQRLNITPIRGDRGRSAQETRR